MIKNLLGSNDSDCSAFFFNSTPRLLQLVKDYNDYDYDDHDDDDDDDDDSLQLKYKFWTLVHLILDVLSPKSAV